MMNIRVTIEEFNAEEMMDRIGETIIREQRIVVRNAAERYKERVLLRLKQRKVFGTPEMRDIKITTDKTMDGWRALVEIDRRVEYLDSGTRPHYIPNTAKNRAYAEHYGLTFKQFRGGIAKRGTKPKPILDYARVLAERQMDRDLRQVIDNL